MSPFRKLLLVTVSAAALCGVQACSTETELNPQPLPPQGGENTPTPAQDPGDKTGDTTGGSSGSSGTPTSAADSGADGAPDGGTDAHDSGAD